MAVTMWRLATNVKYRTLGELFRLGRSTVGKIVHFPTDQTLKQVIRGFRTKSGFPQVAGVIDGTHIQSIQPSVNATDYFNCKGFHSLVMQAVVDFQAAFTDVYIYVRRLVKACT